MNPIYLDYNATTPVDPRVADAIGSALRDLWGNPSSSHAYGRAAHDAVEAARGQVAALIGARADEIVFTGGGSEASNAAIKGVCLTRPRGLVARLFAKAMPHVITSSVEHPATAKPLEYLRTLGVQVTVLDVDRHGLIDPDDVRRAITPRTRLVTVMHSNNETGTLMPVREIGNICRERGVLFHTDCAQSVGKVLVNVHDMFADLVTIAGHKLYAPKGVGALYVREGVELEPLIHGAGHESGRRAGTENTPYIVGLGVAADLCSVGAGSVSDGLQSSVAHASGPDKTVAHASGSDKTVAHASGSDRLLRDRLHAALLAKLGDRISLNGHPERRLPNTLNVNFHGQIGPKLLEKVPRIAASVGAACHEPKPGQVEVTPSAVLCAMRVPPDISQGAVRLTVGRFTTEAEVDEAAELLANGAT